jgi:hypothetical protein
MKYKHTDEVKIVLDDLSNRVQQLIEASERSQDEFKGAKYEQQAFKSVLTILDQVRTTGHVYRGSSAVPDGLLPYVKTHSYQSPLKLVKDTL